MSLRLFTVTWLPALLAGTAATSTHSSLRRQALWAAPSVTAALPANWTSLGCWIDSPTARTLSAATFTSVADMTVETCIAFCDMGNFTLASVEFAQECFCDKFIENNATKASLSDCSIACTGNASETCGGPDRISIYTSTANVTILPVPAAQNTSLPGNWEYQGCLAEPGFAQALPYQLILAANNSATNCLSSCSHFGFPAAGMEFGEECYCGDVDDIAANGGTPAPETGCNMACSGDPIHSCGGAERLSLYYWTGTPLNTWHTPANTGRYEFLIGGFIVPLIATLGINNKVTFLEKLGASPSNTTRAYELDFTLVSDFGAAWREMHVQTDVFGSSGLTLPDKAGRQLNVGGSALDSAFSVRLYAPDGSAGVNGTNDWEENVDEVQLQRGRWYPGAIVLANGSVLVVGGEQGSNGAPSPSLEILLTPAGGDTTLSLDFLNRTDPNILSPFLFVLPPFSHILVIYYNEARLLNATTFATTTVLQALPGAVNDLTAGRTYPLDGTAVLLPQFAPYLEPITVLVCCGSTIGAGIPLDNCVSLQPEVPGANWTIERMPSKRVMASMVTLPDGTFLILNGAQQGEAGFGLATDPNLGAVLYDPSQPVGARMSILNTTIVDRMFHSEAILLPDGRVLVSGSDPEDMRFPQEYRIEVYVPPYLNQGIIQPEFTIASTDWARGSVNAFQVRLFQGTTAGMRVSLVAAASSTHGRSMGQRIPFPSFNCTKSTCTVDAPPCAAIAPPGWFQMFVLDGPTPPHSTWVRIGGDVGQIGNWPAGFADFTPPGI